MTKYLVSVFIVTVLLGGVTANLLMCVLTQMSRVTPDNFILKEPDTICQDTEGKFRRARTGLKNCLGFDIDIRRLKTLHEEFCSPNSDFRQKVERQKNCLSSHLTESLNCASVGLKYSDLIPDALDPTNMDNSINTLCQSSATEMTRCLSEKVGGPCGGEGLEVYGRIAEVSKPIIQRSCLSAARFGVDGVPPDDFKNTFVYSSTVDSDSYPDSAVTDFKSTFVYSSTVDSDSYPDSAVTVHSSTYVMLIALIFILCS